MADLQLPAGGAVAVEVSVHLNYRHRRKKVLNYRKEIGQHGLNVATHWIIAVW